MSSPLEKGKAVEGGLSSFYEQLLQFSLFQGMSRTEMLQMAGNTRFDFLKMPVGKIVVSEGDVCNRLVFLVRGTLSISSQPDSHSYVMTEQLGAPWLLQPEVLFGQSLRYTCTVRTLSDCHFIFLSKDEVLRMLDDFLIFRLNVLNLLASKAQRQGSRPWRRTPQSLSDRVARFFTDHSLYPAGRKELRILMTQLAAEVNDSRLDVSRVLNDMQRKGLVELHRGRIVIPSLERLFM